MDSFGYLVIFTIICGGYLFYKALNRKNNYWSKRGVKGPKPLPIFGNLLSFLVTPRPLVEVNWLKKFGHIYGYYELDEPILMVAEPELVKTILVKDFHLFSDRRHEKTAEPLIEKTLTNLLGDDWKRVRSIVSPTFTSGKMKTMYPMVRQCLTDFMSHLDEFAENRMIIDVKDLYGNYTMDVIATCAFSLKTNAQKGLDNPFVVNAKRLFNISPLQMIFLAICPHFILKLFKSSPFNSIKFIVDTVKDTLSQRRQSRHKYNDFVQLVIDANKNYEEYNKPDDNDVNEAHHVNEGAEELEVQKNVLNVNANNKYMSDIEIMAQALIFLLAGYETTATTLSFCTYELALNPSVQQKLYEEIASVIGADGEISYEELAKLEYLDAVFCETLRLHSPAIKLERMSATDYSLGDTGITVQKGHKIEIPIYAIHYSERFFPNATTYDPDRFLPQNRHKLIPYTYLPFGGGPRSCIGMRFALMEAKLGLAHIITKFRFFATDATDVPLKLKRTEKLTSPQKVVVGIEKRH